MVTTIKVLKRKDASSVVVAVVIALILSQLLPILAADLSGTLSGAADGQYVSYAYPGAGWQEQYLQPVLSAVLQLLILEVLLWVWTTLVAAMKK